MRPSLLHPRGDPRHSRRDRRGRRRAASAPTTAPMPTTTPAPAREPAVVAVDPAVRRAREAGGPIDRASYVCECGLLFSAAVSTTVTCPHCGSRQAW
jgi:hypothetical protein